MNEDENELKEAWHYNMQMLHDSYKTKKKEDEFNNRKASNMSVFYGSEDSSSDSYSILSYKYSNKTDK